MHLPFGREGWQEVIVNILTVNLLFTTLVFGIAARIYVVPRMAHVSSRAILTPILLLHAFRNLGLMFLAPGATYPGIPSEFTTPAAWGDFLAAVLALVALPFVLKGSALARPLVWVFNIEGTLDLLHAIYLATVHRAFPYMGAAYWIPAFWVPALLVTHYLVFVVLLRPWKPG